MPDMENGFWVTVAWPGMYELVIHVPLIHVSEDVNKQIKWPWQEVSASRNPHVFLTKW